MAAVDAQLRTKIRKPRGHRYIDDYELAFQTRSAAEEALAKLEDVLAEFELTINPAKTEILELPQPFHEAWTHQISTFPIRTDKRSRTLSDLIALFPASLPAVSRRRSGPLKFALFRSLKVTIDHDQVWRPFQNLVWSAVSAANDHGDRARRPFRSNAQDPRLTGRHQRRSRSDRIPCANERAGPQRE